MLGHSHTPVGITPVATGASDSSAAAALCSSLRLFEFGWEVDYFERCDPDYICFITNELDFF
jgi:hypothetical protein